MNGRMVSLLPKKERAEITNDTENEVFNAFFWLLLQKTVDCDCIIMQ